MPTSVLLAVLAAAGLLALAPALVRRYDATERLVAERARSTARVLNRTRRRRTVPLPGRPLHASPPAEVHAHAGVRPAVGQSVWLHVDRVAADPASPESPAIAAPHGPDATGADATRADATRGGSSPGQMTGGSVTSGEPDPVRPASAGEIRLGPELRAPARPESERATPPPIPVRRVPSATADPRAGARPNAARKGQAAQPSGRSKPGGAASRTGGVAARGTASRGVPAARRSVPGRTTGVGARKGRPTARQRQHRRSQSPAVYRRRRVLAGLILLNVIELIGVTTVSSGFWTGFAVTLLLLGGYVVHLRNSAIADTRTRRLEARRAARIAVAQAEIREEHERRLAARREALRRAAATRATAQRDAQRLSQRYVDHDPERGGRVRGRPYETGKNYDDHAAGF